jgi:hypothetical protein
VIFLLISNSSNLCISSLRLTIDAVVQDFITDIEVQNLRRAEQSAQLAREKYGADKILEVSDKISELKNLFNLSPYTTL